jgi:hypothetical protein
LPAPFGPSNPTTRPRSARKLVREIARVLAVSVREVYRLLESVVVALVRPTTGSSASVVQGSPGLSDFEGGLIRVDSPAVVPASNDRASTAHGGAIAAAIVSEYAVRARSAQPENDMTDDGRGVRGETNVVESPMAYIQRRIREIIAKNGDRERPP